MESERVDFENKPKEEVVIVTGCEVENCFASSKYREHEWI
jgi:hypothetical protein